MTPARFAFLFFLAAIGAGTLYRTATWAQALPCQENRGAGTFMAYCPTNQYGDYEHGAYYYDLEPEAVKSLQAAKVIVVGNSRTQIAFSTDPVDEYFRARRIPYYLMGFGYDEHVDFAQLLIERYRLRPEILIINSDPFFSHGSTFVAAMVASLDASTLLPKLGSWLEYHEKHLFNALQASLCDRIAGLCSQSVGAIYRETRTGVWHSSAFWVWSRDISTPIDVKTLVPLPAPQNEAVKLAREFIAAAGVRPDCVILMAPPNAKTQADLYIRELGQKLGVRVVLPKVANLATEDGSHLTSSSARLWSARFMADADPIISACVSHP